ncbi:P-type conjugative transfer protein TrbL [Prosthecochloris sp. N3]|uniref:P-type conjugative transfer protein TrbL n=1 Tax=Prosthecochloris ethylica TaxID=2743976 RepID=A0ABR9XUC2_9CHLB|nr:P-type conjugative transfer protein TrbL [Prosthecochloris ethylica]MBF0587331.1 P-type conjugative transfer protein TrbL [Prosthecochloris ethylica]MBF0637574.1 P-type conjugative transfer protein TrbL [Prosthecochloris ethylica]NUK48282.1 P-type conjugative transfer protein TrbL [Prosthecochloris ethylica]
MEPGILTNTLREFLDAFSYAWSNLQPSINWLIGVLLSIEILLLGLWWALSGGEQLANILKKILFLGFWLWLVQSFPELADKFVRSLIKAGEIAGGGHTPNLFNPSQIVFYGVQATKPMVIAINESGWNFANGITFGFLWLLAMLAYIIMAWQIFFSVLEFNLLVGVVGILLPFGFLKSTRFLAEKAIGAVISSGIKLMVLAFVLSVSETVLIDLKLGEGVPSLAEALTVVMVAGGIAFLAWNAPNVASGLLSGSPSLSAQTAVQTAGTAAAIGAAGASGVMAATRAAASAVGGSIRMASAAKTGAQIGSGTAKMAGAGPVGRAAAGVGGAGMAVGKSIWNRTGGKVADFVRGHYAGGAKDAFRATGGRLRSSGEGRSSTAKPRWADAAMSSLRRASELDPSKGGDTTP